MCRSHLSSKFIFAADGNYSRHSQLAKMQRIETVGCLATIDTSTTQPLHPRLRKNHERDRKTEEKDSCCW